MSRQSAKRFGGQGMLQKIVTHALVTGLTPS